jgi:hypothetical protein
VIANNENYCEASKYTIEAFEKVNPKSRKDAKAKIVKALYPKIFALPNDVLFNVFEVGTSENIMEIQ